MTTAREQAREAARTESIRLGGSHMLASAEHYANVASDIWEPREERLKAALRAAGVNERLVEEIANGGDPQGGLTV